MALASLARVEGALQLRLGQTLEVLGRGGVFELGFSSLSAYALERCERSTRWAEGARCLARRLERLPELRGAVAHGAVSWSMADLLGRWLDANGAGPEEEAWWIELAESHTLRQMRAMVAKAMAPGAASAAESQAVAPYGEHAVPQVPAERLAPSERLPRGSILEGQLPSEFQPAGGDEVGEDWRAGNQPFAEMCTLTCTVNREDAWLFEATRCLLDQLGVRGGAAQSEALLAEAQGTLLELLPHGAVDVLASENCGTAGELARQLRDAQGRWLEELCHWRADAEERCERNIPTGSGSSRARRGRASGSCPCAMHPGAAHPGNTSPLAGMLAQVAVAAELGLASLEQTSCTALDRHVRALSAALTQHDLELARLSLRFHRADGWRRLGYATESQYARERLGLSRSSLLARRKLALRLERLPQVAAALEAGQIGIEAAVQLVRVASSTTEGAWVARARARTIKHLREEVAAALTAVRWSGEVDCPPPADAEIAAFQALERAVVGGTFGHPRPANQDQNDPLAAWGVGPRPLGERESGSRRAWLVMLASLAGWLDRCFDNGFDAGPQVSAGAPSATGRHVTSSAGRITLRLRMSRVDAVWWRRLEAQARRWLPRGMSWLRFLCLAMWGAWEHLLGAARRNDVAYGHIYVRDRFRCMSPVCNRRDVTPHRLVFRSAGGGDEDWNIGSLCTWCHLLGVHGGRIRALGTADRIVWELGARGAPTLVVRGRERMAA